MSVLPVGFGSSSTTAYQIANSLRFDGVDDYLSRTFGTPTDGTKWALSIWTKRGTLSVAKQLISSFNSGAAAAFFVQWTAADKIYVFLDKASTGVATLSFTSDAVFRDPTAWCNIHVSFDASQATTALALSVYVNGVKLTGTYTGTIANVAYMWNSAMPSGIGWYANVPTVYYSGYFAEIYNVDGQALTPSSFGELNADNVWVPKAYTGSYGNNGFHLDFSDGTSTTTLGYDAAGSNDWTLNGMTRAAGVNECWMVDTPTDNFATLNWLDANGGGTVGFGGLQITGTGTYNGRRATIPIPAGKWYFEMPANGSTAQSRFCGIVPASVSLAAGNAFYDNASCPTAQFFTSGNGYYRGGGATQTGFSYSSTAVLGIAVDTVNNKMWLAKDDVWFASGDPANGTNPLWTLSSSNEYFPYAAADNTHVAVLNFGQRAFSYTPPTGFKALCTANLPAVAVPNPGTAFQAITATESNIDANLATARSGWANYVDIKKNRTTAESWAWQFSHDSSNEYAIQSGSVTRQTKRTNSGTDAWVGYSIRIGAAYGTAAGSVSHTSGADTTITHNVGVSARQMIFLFPRAGGSTVRVYHPDLTSGYLLDLCGAAAEASNATIKTVTSTSFKIDTSVATGTYDYLVCSEISGLLKLGKYTSNGTSDNAFAYTGQSDALTVIKCKDNAAGDWETHDAYRQTYNVQGPFLLPNQNNAEAATSARLDMTAMGLKIRVNSSNLGQSSQVSVFANWAKNANGSNVSPAPAR